MDCIFCKIVAGEIPCHKIYEDDNTLAFLDISKDVDGHTLVIPKKHCVNILDCDNESLSNVTKTVKFLSNHFVDNCGFEGVNLINASGKVSGQTVYHLHFHIFPRKNNDNVKLFNQNKLSKLELEEMAKKLAVK